MKLEKEIKQAKFRNVHQKAVINLLFTASWLENNHNKFFKRHGITGIQFNILRILRGQYPNKVSGAQLKLRMLDKNSDVSRLLDRLIAKKLIEKSICTHDKRASDVVITKKGLHLLKSIDSEIDKTDSEALAITASEAKQLSDLLDKCRG
ncbi:MAG: MarR family transcriptional regulator [Bacteroidetes bacterium]|jgi:DNA-binding MarR family transcriptional regulator|nr:MarR family transcriptional regulator [Bacteroidota bacterium]MBS1979563.1 MarR family transcriptional regulator [Bacteroidota bacterium]